MGQIPRPDTFAQQLYVLLWEQVYLRMLCEHRHRLARLKHADTAAVNSDKKIAASGIFFDFAVFLALGYNRT